MKRWTGEDGLISNNLTSVSQTENGFLWITSFNGLHRFDGNGFELFDKKNSTFLRTNAFQSVASEEEGILVATEGNGVLRYQDGILFPVPEFEVSSVFKLLIDSKGRTWCGTNLEGLHVREYGKVSRIAHESLDNVLIFDIYEDRQNRIWIATEGNGLFFYENGTITKYEVGDLAPERFFTTITQSANGEMVFGTVNGLYIGSVENDVVSQVPNLAGVYVNDVVEDQQGMLWIASERGLYRINLQTGYFEEFNAQNGLPAQQISSIAIDHEGSTWVSTKKAGLIRLNHGSVNMVGEREGLLSKRINTVVEKDGKLFIGSDDGSIWVKEEGAISTIDLSTKREQVGVRDFLIEEEKLWVASYRGLHLYEDKTETLLTTADGLSSNLIRRILKTEDGLWLGSRTGGVMKIRDGRVTKIYNNKNGLNSDFILALEEDQDGNIAVGTHSGGIAVIYSDTVISYQPEIKGLVNFNIHVDEKNRYWISTSAGVFLFQNGTFRKLNIDAAFNREAIFDFVPDTQGNAWLTSTMGIIKIPALQINQFAIGKIDTVEGRIFDTNDGMLIKECTGATRSTLLSNGAISFPTLQGIAMIHPEKLRVNTQIPKISITSFSVDDETIPRGKDEIEPGKLRYQFEFAATSYLATDRVRFKYKLSDVDTEWITSEDNQIEYTNLFPNTYTFSVIGSNGYGLWNDVGDSITFTVKPFFYQTFLFRALIVLFVGVVFYFVFVWRVSRVQAVNAELSKVNSELDRFVYSASHDIRAPLTSILGATKIAIDEQSPEEKNIYLNMISSSAKKLDGFIRDIIDYSRNQRLEVIKETINVRDEIGSMVESLKYLDENGKIACNLDVPDQYFETDVRRLRVILKNIVANACFYFNPEESKPFVSIYGEIVGSDLVVTIADNGVGMKKEVLNNIFTMFYRGSTDSRGSGLGLYIVKENIDKLGGKIAVDSVFKKGTTFTVTIPGLEKN